MKIAKIILAVAMFLCNLTTGIAQDNRDLDLPVSPENKKLQVPPLPPVPLPADDPQDEPSPTIYGEEIEAENGTLIYVIDISGSMTQAKMTSAQREMTKSIDGLSPSIRFNAISFSCQLTKLWPQMQRADFGHKAEAITWTWNLHAGGGTGTGPAMVLALSEKTCMSIALLTDGAPGCGISSNGLSRVEAHRLMINDANSQRATINVFGIEAYGDWRAFCQNVAGDSGGSYYDIPK